MARTPAKVPDHWRRPKKHEHGVLVGDATSGGFITTATPEQARETFEKFVRNRRASGEPELFEIYRLIIAGQEVERVELRGEGDGA